MANPFPGMDPFLEGPLWTTVHSNLTEEIARQLAPKLRPKYLAFCNQRIVIAPPDEIELPPHRTPDVSVVAGATPVERTTRSAAPAAPLVLHARVPVATPQNTVEIRDALNRKLVTAIEVLSPTNKRGAGHRQYIRKRREMLRSQTNFMEIDLLRIGKRYPVAETLPSVPYFVFLSRAHRRSDVEIWPISLESPLPEVPVPLLPDDGEVALDLQSALNNIHDLFSYEQSLDYHQPPTVALPPDLDAWMDARLRSLGRR